MKRKLIVGIGLVTCIFVLSGIFIAASLSELRLVTNLKDRQQKIATSYDRMLYLISDDQTDLYAFEAGYKRNLDMVRGNIRKTRSLLSSLREDYAAYSSATACRHCHFRTNPEGGAETLEGTQHHEKTLRDISIRIAGYEEKINRVFASGYTGSAGSLVKAAAADSEEIEGFIEKVRGAMDRMNDGMEKLELAELRRSKYSIVSAIALSILFSCLIVAATIRSITKPMNMLVHGIEKVSSGDYSSKVGIQSNDEFGLVARTFNRMTDALSEMTAQKETLLNELTDLNSSLEQRVQEATAELRIAHEMVLRNETLSAVGTFASGVAHELATPIASIMTYFQMVKEKIPVEDKLAEDVQIIERELKRCNTILRGMLDFARAPEKEKTLTNINAIVHDLLALVKYQPAYKRTIAITEELADGIPMVRAVPGQLRQVFMNMIVNALQSMPSGGTLSVSTSLAEDGRRVVVSISDTGRGIPQSELDRIFRPFYTSRETGTGLGLSISFGIITGHGGDIEVKSEGGKGTTFYIYLPVSSGSPFMSAPQAAGIQGAGEGRG